MRDVNLHLNEAKDVSSASGLIHHYGIAANNLRAVSIPVVDPRSPR